MTTLTSNAYLELFIKDTYYRAFRFAYNMVAHRPAAEVAAQDITQDAYERLLVKLKCDPSMLKRLGKEQITTYLLTIIRYLGYELSRNSQHFVEIDSMYVDQDGDQDIEDPTPAADVETFVLVNDATSNLLRRIRPLPEQQPEARWVLSRGDCSAASHICGRGENSASPCQAKFTYLD